MPEPTEEFIKSKTDDELKNILRPVYGPGGIE
jgi:hypothetical protein